MVDWLCNASGEPKNRYELLKACSTLHPLRLSFGAPTQTLDRWLRRATRIIKNDRGVRTQPEIAND